MVCNCGHERGMHNQGGGCNSGWLPPFKGSHQKSCRCAQYGQGEGSDKWWERIRKERKEEK